MIELLKMTPAEVGMLLDRELTFPVIAYAAIKDGEKFLGAGGLAWGEDKRCWLWFDWADLGDTHPVIVVRVAKRMLQTARQFAETEVWVARDEHPLSEKLLKMLGFERAAEEHDGEELWKKWLR